MMADTNDVNVGLIAAMGLMTLFIIAVILWYNRKR